MSLSFYPDLIHEGDLSPECEPEIEEACEEIREAVKGWGTDEQALIDVLGSKSAEERTKIYFKYQEIHDKELDHVMKKEEGGDFGMALQLLSLPPDAMDAKLIHMALKGLGTNEDHLYPVVCGRSNADMEALKKAFFRKYEEDVTLKIDEEIGGDFQRLIITCLQGLEEDFDEEVHTEDKAKEDAAAFYEAGQGKWGTEEGELFKILCMSPPEHLAAINDAYADEYGYTLFKAFEEELNGCTDRAAIFALGMKLKPYETIAKLIKKACDGIGTDETLLTSSLIRYRSVLPEVNEAFTELYEQSLQEAVTREEGGDLGKLYAKLTE